MVQGKAVARSLPLIAAQCSTGDGELDRATERALHQPRPASSRRASLQGMRRQPASERGRARIAATLHSTDHLYLRTSRICPMRARDNVDRLQRSSIFESFNIHLDGAGLRVTRRRFFPRHAEVVAFWQLSGYRRLLAGLRGQMRSRVMPQQHCKAADRPVQEPGARGVTGVALPASGCISAYRGGLGTQTGLGRIRSRCSPAADGMAGSDVHFTLPFGNCEWLPALTRIGGYVACRDSFR